MITLCPGNHLTCNDLVQVARFGSEIEISKKAKSAIDKSRNFIEERVAAGDVIYGVNTGFGDFSKVNVEPDVLKDLQRNIIRSHSVGVGPLLDEEVVRAMMVLRINSLIQGYSGVRFELIELLAEMLNKNIIPCVPSQGSLGASGDLAPLSHIALAMMGEGEVFMEGKKVETSKAFSKAGIKAAELDSKEGLALINGTQMITGIGALAVYDAENLALHADLASAFSTDVMGGTIAHTFPTIHTLRGHEGQIESAKNIRKFMEGSEILKSHESCGRVQDAYTLRCAPQVHGATRDTITHCKKIIETEMNAVTDNPLIFHDIGKVLSAGNFHGQPVAFVADFLSIAVAELANISERRTARLVDRSLNDCLPHFLTSKGGLNSGLMIAQYTAASLVSENKIFAHPASVDSITSSANQEDHVSMGAHGARKCREIIKNTENVIAIELLCAAQALDFRRPLKTSKILEKVHLVIRKKVSYMDEDRYLHPDMVAVQEMVSNREIVKEL